MQGSVITQFDMDETSLSYSRRLIQDDLLTGGGKKLEDEFRLRMTRSFKEPYISCHDEGCQNDLS